MPSRDIVVASRIGLHGRPAAMVVRTAAAQPVRVMISKADGKPVDAASILAVLALGARGGDTVTTTAEGPDADAALDAVAALLLRDLDSETADA
jgi:phosphocarrier protein HPr